MKPMTVESSWRSQVTIVHRCVAPIGFRYALTWSLNGARPWEMLTEKHQWINRRKSAGADRTALLFYWRRSGRPAIVMEEESCQ